MPVLPASLLHADSQAPIACLRPSEEKLAALALSISAERGEPPARGPRQELYVGEIRDALMPHGSTCPRCQGFSVVRYGKRGAVQRYKCKSCPCYFTDLTGSVLHRIRRRDRWLDFCLCMVEGLSIRETARILGNRRPVCVQRLRLASGADGLARPRQLDRQAQGAVQHLRPPRSRPALPRAERPTRGVRLPLLAEAVPRRRNKAPAPILLVVRPHSRHGPRARPCRRQATLLRGPRGLFPAQAGVAPPKAS